MKTFSVKYCDRGNCSDLLNTNTLNEALDYANAYVERETIAADVDPTTDTADIFKLEVWSYDDTTEADPELVYETEYYYSRF